jgi:hypothetical protein
MLLLLLLPYCIGHLIRCDLPTYLARQPFVDKRTDLPAQLQFFTVGIHGNQLEHLFVCKGEQESDFTTRRGIVLHAWRFGEIRVLELSDDHSWKKEELQEFELRVTGYAGEWGQPMNAPSWLARQGGYLYDWTWGVTVNALPFAVLFSTQTSQHRRCSTSTSSLQSSCPRTFCLESEDMVEALNMELIRLAVNAFVDRALATGETHGYTKGYNAGYRAGTFDHDQTPAPITTRLTTDKTRAKPIRWFWKS